MLLRKVARFAVFPFVSRIAIISVAFRSRRLLAQLGSAYAMGES